MQYLCTTFSVEVAVCQSSDIGLQSVVSILGLSEMLLYFIVKYLVNVDLVHIQFLVCKYTMIVIQKQLSTYSALTYSNRRYDSPYYVCREMGSMFNAILLAMCPSLSRI